MKVINERAQSESGRPRQVRSRAFFVDLAIYLPVIFLIREVYFESLGFLANGIFWSFTGLAVAAWRMKARGVSWSDLGLRKTPHFKMLITATAVTLGMAIGSIVVFEILKDQFAWDLSPDTSNEAAVSKFGNLKNNWVLFFSIIPVIWLESFLEELLDRGFMMNWLERMFSSTLLATILAVILQAVIFGFRHSNDFSERSITVGLIGLGMGVGYVLFGRNLWPLILAHCVLNTVSMLDRVG
ncbi:MAG: CPBP family intramembrane metalloprotease [Planctomycetes bacterium]|nr:CPBP family intramembrane metalloprotease [Planctomycetota bacterium]